MCVCAVVCPQVVYVHVYVGNVLLLLSLICIPVSKWSCFSANKLIVE